MPRSPEQFEEIRNKTKKQILEAGLKVFAEKGYHGASMAEIAKEAGVSKGLAYNYFSGKKDLAEAVVRQMETMMQEMEEQLSVYTDPFDIIKATIQFTLHHVKENEQFWRLYLSFVSQVELYELVKKVFGGMISELVGFFAQVFKSIGVENPEEEAYILGSILDGVPIDFLMDPEHYPMDRIEAQLIKKYSREEMLGRK